MLQQLLQQYFDTPQGVPMIHLDVGTHDAHRDHSKFRASDAGKCHRMRYWKRQGKAGKQDLTFEVQMAMQTGNLLHAFIQHALGEAGVLFASEMPLEDAHRIGHLDALVNVGDKLMLYDFKTVGGKQMYYLKQDQRPKPEHVAQVLTYYQMYVNAEERSQEYRPIDYCQIAYISRDTLDILDLTAGTPGLFPSENMDAINADWHAVINYWDRQETPPMTRTGWECKY